MSKIIIKTKSRFSFGMRIGDETFVDTDKLPESDRTIVRLWTKNYPETVRPDPGVDGPDVNDRPPAPADTRPNVIERKAPDVPFVDPIQRLLNESIRQQIEQQQVDARLTEYQIVQGLVDDQHNAALLRDWIERYGQGYAAAVNIDRAIRALRPSLHWQRLSAFTKRLATLR
jgi:hypothetical protein